MNERRQFLKMVAAGPAGAALLPLFAQTGQCSATQDVEQVAETLGRLPANIIYTKDHQGVWKGKSGSHLPQLNAERSGDKLKLTVTTKHGMVASHYIVRHTVVDGSGEVLGAKTFNWKDKPVSTYEIDLPAGGKRGLFVMSYCSKHDLWLAQTQLDV
jgi:desulfoferrodoxin (superoxide reductase-like protein)